MLYPLSLEERTAKSGLIVEGEVISQYSFWDSKHQLIYTSNLIEVYKVFKGSLSATRVEVITEGGTVGNKKHVHTPSLQLSEGQMGVFFCETSRISDPQSKRSEPEYMVYGSLQGFIRYSLSDGTASEPFRKYNGIETDVYNSITTITGAAPLEVAENRELINSYKSQGNLFPNAVPSLSSFTPTTITAGTDQVLTITGIGFGIAQGTGFVEFKDSDDGGATLVKPLASDYVSWTDTEIKVHVPSQTLGSTGTAGTGTIKVTNSDPASVTSAGTLTIEYAYSNVLDAGTDGGGAGFPDTSQMPDHIRDDGVDGYIFTMETGEFTPTAADDAFLRAMNTWTCATGINWTTTTGVTDTNIEDDINVVRFADDETDPLPAGVLGRASSYYDGCAVAAGYFTWEVDEIDIKFDDQATVSWEFGPALPIAGESDFESVALHELGHTHLLGHVISPGAVMHFSITTGTSNRVLSAADIAGGRYIMTRSVVANACNTGPMIAATGVACGPTSAPASISGQVTLADGAPLAGVAIRMSGLQDRMTITDATGNYHFDSVDTEEFYTITPALVNYQFYPGNLSFSLLANKTDAGFTAIPDAVIVGNAIDTSEYFVRQHYLDFLGREPDESGFNFWSDQIASCGNDAGCVERKRINVSAAYFLSIEFQNTGGLVDGLYRASFGRRPLYAEFMPDAQNVAQGVIVGRGDWEAQLRNSKQAFVQSFVNRAAFRAAYDGLSSTDFVDALISHTGVNIADRDALVSGLSSGALTRADVLLRIAENERFVSAKRNAAFVMMEYFGYLRRDPDESGYQFWLNKLNQFDGNFERAEMIKAFITSIEYRARFQR